MPPAEEVFTTPRPGPPGTAAPQRYGDSPVPWTCTASTQHWSGLLSRTGSTDRPEHAGWPDVYLSSVAFELGARVGIDELDDPAIRKSLTALRDEGIQHCRLSTEPASRLAALSSARSIAAAGSGEPTAAVYCAESPGTASFCHDVWDFLVAMGRPTLPTVTVGGNACGNLPPALRIARNTILTERGSSVLLVTTNKRGQATRFIEDGQTVISDGAASCLVSAHLMGSGFRVLGVSDAVRADFPQSGSSLTRMSSVVKGVARAVEGLSHVSGVGGQEYDLLITGNYGTSVRYLFATAAGMDVNSVYAPQVADIGHCFAGDLLISLAHAEASGVLKHGARVLLLGTSPRSWTCAALEYVRAETE